MGKSPGRGTSPVVAHLIFPTTICSCAGIIHVEFDVAAVLTRHFSVSKEDYDQLARPSIPVAILLFGEER